MIQCAPRRNGSRAVIAWTLLVGLLSAGARAETPYTTVWIRQLGTSGVDESYGVSADRQGHVYITGRTFGSLGSSNAGTADAFVRKYDAAGTLLWDRQVGTASADTGYGVAADRQGNVYISGSTEGSLGSPNAGLEDAFLSKYDAQGNLIWTRQVGTEAFDVSYSIAVDRLGSVYISGWTLGALGAPRETKHGIEAFVCKFDGDGKLLWTRQLGLKGSEGSRGLAADGQGNVYVAGYVSSAPGETDKRKDDAFLSKLDATGQIVWTQHIGTTFDDAGFAVAADEQGNAYITGVTRGSLGGPNAGLADAFVTKYDPTGNRLWVRQLGTPKNDRGFGVAVGADGNVYISGSTSGSLGGPNAGGRDLFVSKFDSSGNLSWTKQLGTTSEDRSLSISAGEQGDVFVSGYTAGTLAGSRSGEYDAFVLMLSPAKKSMTLLIVVAAIVAFWALTYKVGRTSSGSKWAKRKADLRSAI